MNIDTMDLLMRLGRLLVTTRSLVNQIYELVEILEQEVPEDVFWS